MKLGDLEYWVGGLPSPVIFDTDYYDLGQMDYWAEGNPSRVILRLTQQSGQEGDPGPDLDFGLIDTWIGGALTALLCATHDVDLGNMSNLCQAAGAPIVYHLTYGEPPPAEAPEVTISRKLLVIGI